MPIKSLDHQRGRNTRASTANTRNNGFHCVVCQKKPALKDGETPEAHMNGHAQNLNKRFSTGDIKDLIQGNTNEFSVPLQDKLNTMRAIHESLQGTDSSDDKIPSPKRRRVAESPVPLDSISVVTPKDLDQQKKDLEANLQQPQDAFEALQEASQGQVSEKDAKIEDLMAEINALRAETTTKDKKNTELTAQPTTTQEQIPKQSEEVTKLRASLAKAKSDTSTQQKRADKLHRELASADRAIGKHEQAYEALAQELAGYKAQAEAKLKQMQEELAKTKEGLEKMSRGEVAFVINGQPHTPMQMYADNVNLAQRNKELIDILRLSDSTIDALTNNLQEERQGKLDALKEAGHYNNRNNELTAQVEQLTKKLNSYQEKERQEAASALGALANLHTITPVVHFEANTTIV